MSYQLPLLESGRMNAPIVDRKLKEEFLLSRSRIICTTLSTGANKGLEKLEGEIDYLIVDEACQCTELTSLHPFFSKSKTRNISWRSKLVASNDHE